MIFVSIFLCVDVVLLTGGIILLIRGNIASPSVDPTSVLI